MRRLSALLLPLTLALGPDPGALPHAAGPPAAASASRARAGLELAAPAPAALEALGAAILGAAPAAGPRPPGFYFTRAAYTGGRWGRPAWTTDYPKADRQLNVVLRRLLPTLDNYALEHPVKLTDPELRRFPFLYAVEVGQMQMTDEDVAGLRSFLAAGGFLMVDDFWGTREWENFDEEIHRVLPGRPIIDIPLSHPIFHTYYDIQKIVQVPNGPRICQGYPTWEQDGYVPTIRGILDDAGRIMVLIDWNSDMGDAWEWAEQSCYPLEYSTYAFQMTVNTIVYAMSR